MEDLATLRQARALGVGAGRETRMKTWPPRHSANRPPHRKGEEGGRRASRPGNGPGRALDLAMLYPFPPTVGSSSPWGPIQHLTPLGPDAVAVSTASHGGIRVSLAALARIPAPLQATAYSGAGWFEEDCDWVIPYLALGLDAFEPDAARAAEVWAAAVHTVKRYHPQHAAVLGADGDPEGRRHG